MADEDRQRDRGSRLCGCKFRIKLVESINGSFFLVHDLSAEHAKHNHELSTIPSVHPSLRKLENEAKASIERQIAVGSTPKQILALQLHDQSSGQAPPTPRDIYNLGAIAKRKASHCLEPPEALLAHLRDNNYEVVTRSEYVTGATQRLSGIRFSHPDAITLTKRYPVAITIDATYKTNKYGMPLVHIIGLTATGNTFCSAVALVTREREVDYLWVLDEYNKMMAGLGVHVIITDRDVALGNAVAQIFPQAQHNLCRWHLNKNIATNCKSFFSADDLTEFQRSWSQLVGSTSESEYEANSEALLLAFHDLPFVQNYISGLLNLKTHFVSAGQTSIYTSDRHQAPASKEHIGHSKASLERALATSPSSAHAFTIIWPCSSEICVTFSRMTSGALASGWDHCLCFRR
ncbi:hypothetical protein CF319_g9050 [Tilletia indica]|nr:hypothetical protein CF319_g9050 [Tilletia indica]